MAYNFISSDSEIREQISINYRFYAIKAFEFALLTPSGDVVVRKVENTFVNNPLYKKGNFPLKTALSEFVDLNTSPQERAYAREFGVKIVALKVEPYGRRPLSDSDDTYNFDLLD